MNSKSLLLTVAIVAVLMSSAFSQFEYISYEKAQALSKRTILVELFDEVSDEEIQTNEFIKEYFQQNLNIGKEVICISGKEINALLKSHKEKYAIITHDFDSHNVEGVSRNRRADNGRTAYASYTGPTYKQRNILATLSHFDLSLSIISSDKKLKGIVTEVGFIHFKLRPEDYVFAAHQFNRLYNASLSEIKSKNYYDPKGAMASLETKTFLVDKGNIDFMVKDAKGYAFDYKFVEYNLIKEAIFSKTPQKVYALLIWSNQINAIDWVIVDTETGEIYSQITHGGVNVVAFGENEPPLKMGIMHFKSFDSSMANKLNNKY